MKKLATSLKVIDNGVSFYTPHMISY